MTGSTSTNRLGLSELETETGRFEMMSPKGFLADEGFAHSLAIMGRVATRPAHVRKMVWLMPRMAKPSRTSGTSSSLAASHCELGTVKVYDFVDEGLGHSSYLIDLGDGTAAVVDPPRFPIAHDALAERLGPPTAHGRSTPTRTPTT